MTVAERVLVLDDFRQTLAALRSLRSAGYLPTVGVEAGKTNFSIYSNNAHGVWEHPPLSRPAAFLPALNDFLDRNQDCRLILPIGETSLSFLLKAKNEIRSCLICGPELQAVDLCIDKTRMVQAASSWGVAVPQTIVVENLPALKAAVARLKLPCSIKPDNSLSRPLGKKALYFHTEQELEAFSAWPNGVNRLLVQRKITGRRYNVDFAAEHGQLLTVFMYKALRSDSWDQTGYTVDALRGAIPELLLRYCAVIVKRLNYTGIGLFQFLHAADEDEFYLLELNPRLGLFAAFSFDCGLNFSALAVRLAKGEPIGFGEREHLKEKALSGQGRRCHWCTGDAQGLLTAIKENELSLKQALVWSGQIAVSLLRADCHLTWKVRDPLPTLAILRQIFRSIRKHSNVISQKIRGRKAPAAKGVAHGRV